MESNNIYKTYSVYEQLKDNEELLLPNMSYVEDIQKVCLQDEPLEIEDLNYFYIEALEDNLKVAFISNVNENVLQYSTDKETWHTLNPTSDNSEYSLDGFNDVDYTLPINANEKIWFKGKLIGGGITAPISIDDEVMPTDVADDTSPVGHFYISKPCNVGGNIFSLTYGNDFADKTKFKGNESFEQLFNNELIVDASNLILPATILVKSCYYQMFDGCTYLTTAPELPATTLANYCYYQMFDGCTALTTVPELPATALAYKCYESMFSGCTSLTTAPELPATVLADDCYEYMFYGCTSLTNIRINVSCECSEFFNETFNYCKSLSNVYLVGDAYEDVYSIFEDIIANSVNLYCTLNTYAISHLPSHYTINITDADFVEYKSLVLNSANNVNSKDTYTIVGYTVTETYNKNGENVDIEIRGSGMSNQFEENTSTEQIERTISFTYKSAITAETTITQSAYIDATYKNYLCITALTDGIFRYNNPANKTLYYKQVPYMYADGSGWTTLNEIELFAGQSIYIKGTGVSSNSVYKYNSIFYSTCKFNVSGNIMSLLYGDDFEGKTYLSGYNYAFKYLFFNSQNIISAKNLILPATILTNYCYYGMFSYCTSLIEAPQLPATTLASYCYNCMFSGCTSLTSAPELPATTLATYCYQSMFYGCTSLTSAPVLPATTLVNYCYYQMFSNCTSLTTASELPAITLANSCYTEMFNGCTSLVTAPQLPATTLVQSCYQYMFNGCTSLVNAPQLPATTLVNCCYYQMFGGCTSLVNAPELPATTLAEQCYLSMFFNCTSLTTAPELPATTLAYQCYDSMFYGCTALTTAPELPATTLVQSCYNYMFNRCVALNNVQQIFIDEYNCYGMFDDVCETGTIILDSTISRKDINKCLYGYCSLPKTWTIDYVDYSNPVECKSLSVVPQKETVECYETSIKLNVTTVASYMTTNGIQLNDVVYTYVDESDTFEENTEYNDITRTVSYNAYGLTATTEVTQRAYKDHVKQNYMYITALEDCTIYVYGNNRTTVYWSKTNHKYVDGSGWAQLGGSYASLKAGETIYIKGGLSNTSGNWGYLQCTSGKISVGGNIMSLIYGDDFEDKYELPNTYAFYKLFYGCKQTLVDASQLILPATTLTSYCYNSMFSGCTKLINGPKLPATTLAPYCYREMFSGCTSLTCMGGILAEHYDTSSCESMFEGCSSLINAPYIAHIKTLDSWCCSYMFWRCTSLIKTPELPTTTLASNCYHSMFADCTSLITTSELPATTLAIGCYSNMFSNCTALTTAPALPATTLAANCYDNMFSGCTSLTTVPELPATTLAANCYYNMFGGCISLTTAPELPATTLEGSCYAYMFSGCTSLVNVPELPATTLAVYCYSSMFQECTSITSAPVLHATTLDSWCYNTMFYKCKKLNKIIYLGNSINTQHTTDWVYNVSSTGTFVINKNLEPEYGVNFVPYGWTVETIDMDNPVQCYELHNVTADNIKCQDTKAKISYSGLFRYASEFGTYEITKETTGTYIYSGIPVNETSEDVQHDITFTLGDRTINITITQSAQEEFEYPNYLCITSLENNNDITFDGCSSSYYIESSIDNITYVNDATYGWKRTTSPGENIATLQAGDSIYIRGNFRNKTAKNGSGIGLFRSTGKFNLSGNIMSLLDNYDFENADYTNSQAVKQYQFYNLFGATSVVDASSLILPATILADSCYEYMFQNCTAFVTAPELPATTLANYCYTYMFNGCTSLVNAPELPATTLAEECYERMFQGCTSLTTAPELPATTLVYGCYRYMFYGCTSLTTAPELPATTVADSCYAYMFWKCTSLTTAPKLPATTLATNCYYQMFKGCTLLTTAPQLPATTLATQCYEYMFSYCASLTEAPQLPATILTESCYAYMFEYCTSLTTAPELPATTLASYCYSYMFYGCSSLVNVPSELPAINLATYCYQYMFNGCTSLVTAPKLLGANLKTNCYRYMFYGCRKLSNITMLASSLSSTSMTYWVYNVASTGTFYKHPTMTSLTTGNNGIPTGWTVVDYGEVVECTSLTITAPDVTWRATNAPITYTAIVNLNVYGTIYQNITQTGTVTSEEFQQNMDPNNTVEHTLSYTYMGITATTTITQGAYYDAYYTVNLNNQWQLSTSYVNLDESQYDGIYESFSNRNQDSTNAVMYINISGYIQFRLYIGSYGESSYDYTIASTLDGTSNYLTTSGFQYAPTSLSSFKEVVYDNIDGGEHTITITYRKDGSVNKNDDRGYLLIPKNQ